VLSMSTHYPVFCLEHRPPSAPTPLQDEDDVEEGDDLRSRLRLAENVCYYAQRLLKEPTTNLDYENKRGLAIALAQIIATRATQANFQLVIITHDEDFVKLMSAELSANQEFSMPEWYFRVSREESEDHAGKHFSHIERIPWQNL